MMVSGSTASARPTGSTLAIATATINSNGTASQVQAVVDPVCGAMRALLADMRRRLEAVDGGSARVVGVARAEDQRHARHVVLSHGEVDGRFHQPLGGAKRRQTDDSDDGETLPLISTPPLAGRMFGGADLPGGCRVAIVNAEAAREFFGGVALAANSFCQLCRLMTTPPAKGSCSKSASSGVTLATDITVEGAAMTTWLCG